MPSTSRSTRTWPRCAAIRASRRCSRAWRSRAPATERSVARVDLRALEELVRRARLPPGLPLRHRLGRRGRLELGVEAEALVRRLGQRLRAERAGEQALVAQSLDQRRDRGPVAQAQARARELEAQVERVG